MLADLCPVRLREGDRIHEVGDAQTCPCDLVTVGRADASPRRADLFLSEVRLTTGVDSPVVGEREVGSPADEQVVGRDRNPLLCQRVDLLKN